MLMSAEGFAVIILRPGLRQLETALWYIEQSEERSRRADPLLSMASNGPVTTYEQERQARIAANRARMEALGVGPVRPRPCNP